MNVETIDLRRISDQDARTIGELLCTIWPKTGRTLEQRMGALTYWHSYEGPDAQHPRSFIVREDGQIVAHASIMPRTIGITAGDMTVLALARVCTVPAVRGRKLGRAVVRAAFDLVDKGVFPFALFQTTEGVRPFYERLGAVSAHNRFINSRADDPGANPWWDVAIMRYPHKPGWPSGEIDLRGQAW
jgi:predicted GNAT family N-acyltransferase